MVRRKRLNMLEQLKNYTGKDRLVSSEDMSEALKQTPVVSRYKYGMANIDYLTEGFETGEVIIITGWPSFGKTTFLRSMLTNFSKQGLPILSISYEGKMSQFFRKLSSPLPHFYLPRENKSYDIDWIEEKIKEGVSKHKIKVILLDHLHFIITPPGNKTDTYAYTLQVGALIRRIKEMSVKYDVAIFLVCHCGKAPKNSDGKPPPLPQQGDLKDSSSIDQDSDAVYVIQRVFRKRKGYSSKSYEATNDTEFYIIKQRETGKLGKIALLTYSNGELIPAISLEDEKAL